MELAHPVAEVLAQPVAMTHQLAQLLGGGRRQPGRGRALLAAEASEPQRIDGVGPGAFQVLALEAMAAQRVDQCDVEARRAATANRFFQ